MRIETRLMPHLQRNDVTSLLLHEVVRPVLQLSDGTSFALKLLSITIDAMVTQPACPSPIQISDVVVRHANRAVWATVVHALRMQAANYMNESSNAAPAVLCAAAQQVLCRRVAPAIKSMLDTLLQSLFHAFGEGTAEQLRCLLRNPSMFIHPIVGGDATSSYIVSRGEIVLQLADDVQQPPSHAHTALFLSDSRGEDSDDDESSTDVALWTRWLEWVGPQCQTLGVTAVYYDGTPPFQADVTSLYGFRMVRVEDLASAAGLHLPVVELSCGVCIADSTIHIVGVKRLSLKSCVLQYAELATQPFTPGVCIGVPVGDGGVVWRERRSLIIDALTVASKTSALVSRQDHVLHFLATTNTPANHTAEFRHLRGCLETFLDVNTEPHHFPESDWVVQTSIAVALEAVEVLLRVTSIIV